MIRYLQKLRASKGFTMVELIIVIAIMAILMAMILPAFSSDDAEKEAAETYASDFYASLQYNMTRYQKTEFHITPQLQELAEKYEDGEDVEPYIMFSKDRCANIFTMQQIYIEVAYDKGIKYVKIAPTLKALIKDTATTSDEVFEKLLHKDLADVMNAASKGHYYAVVRYDYDPSNPLGNTGYGDLKVKCAHYCEEALPSDTSGSYVTDNLIFTEFSVLKCGIICGTCSSDKKGSSYVGSIETNFLNVTDDSFAG